MAYLLSKFREGLDRWYKFGAPPPANMKMTDDDYALAALLNKQEAADCEMETEEIKAECPCVQPSTLPVTNPANNLNQMKASPLVLQCNSCLEMWSGDVQ